MLAATQMLGETAASLGYDETGMPVSWFHAIVLASIQVLYNARLYTCYSLMLPDCMIT
jgi:hypothetical protein